MSEGSGGFVDPGGSGFVPFRHSRAVEAAHMHDIAAIAERLDREVVFIDDERFENEITAGALADGGRKLAWIDSRRKNIGSAVDITFTLRARIDGRPVIDWEVASYNPYFGCDVQLIGWWGETVILIYSEKHRTVLAALAEGLRPRLRYIGEEWEQREDRVYYRSEAQGLLDVIALPTLVPSAPLPESMLEGPGPACEPLATLSDKDSLVRKVMTAAFGEVSRQPETDLLVGSQLFPFWTPFPEVFHEYVRGYRGRFSRSPPVWLPLYWHLKTMNDGSSAMMSTLEQGRAAHANTDCGLANRAIVHLRSRCAELFTACENGRLPEGAFCYFWTEGSLKRFESEIDAFPTGVATCFNVLKADKDRWYVVGENRGA